MFEDHTDRRHRSNKYVSIFSGILFGAAWMVFIDAVIVTYKIDKCRAYEWVGGIAGTIGLFLIENLPSAMFQKKGGWSEEAECYQKVILIIATFLLFGGMVSAIWIFLGAKYFVETTNDLVKFRGWGAILQTFLIMLSAFAWRFMWRDPSDY